MKKKKGTFTKAQSIKNIETFTKARSMKKNIET